MLVSIAVVIIAILICLICIGITGLCIYALIKETKNIADAVLGLVGFLFFGSVSILMVDAVMKKLL